MSPDLRVERARIRIGPPVRARHVGGAEAAEGARPIRLGPVRSEKQGPGDEKQRPERPPRIESPPRHLTPRIGVSRELFSHLARWRTSCARRALGWPRTVLGGEVAVPCHPQSALAGLNARLRVAAFGVSTSRAALTARSRAMRVREPGQIRKEAALSGSGHVPRIRLARAKHDESARGLLTRTGRTVLPA